MERSGQPATLDGKKKSKTMIIEHTDRAGKTWRFSIPCERSQGEAIRRALAGVRNMRTAPALCLTQILQNEPREAALFGAVEAALLNGLLSAFPVQPTAEEREREAEAAPLAELSANEEGRPRYWWEE